jgi:hypothetical protein
VAVRLPVFNLHHLLVYLFCVMIQFGYLGFSVTFHLHNRVPTNKSKAQCKSA